MNSLRRSVVRRRHASAVVGPMPGTEVEDHGLPGGGELGAERVLCSSVGGSPS